MAHSRREDLKDPRQRLPQRPDPHALKYRTRQRAASFARDQHLGARRALGVRQHAVLLYDERAPQRHHHEDAEDAPREGQHRDLEIVEEVGAVRREEDQRRHGEDDTRGHRLAGRSNRLHDVVFENRRATEPFEHGNRQHGDRDRGAHRQARAQAEVDGGRSEEEAEHRADDDRFEREFGGRLGGRHVRLKHRRRRRGRHGGR